jgi:cephalosporin-C deacetylase-like acetyl esterase
MRRYSGLSSLLLALSAAVLWGQESAAVLEVRRRNLVTLIKILNPSHSETAGRINATDKTWEEWLQRSGELPPDFDAMPSIPELPDPLVIRENGKAIRVTSQALWSRQRGLIRSQFEHWIYGRMPPAPDNLRATVTSVQREGEVAMRDVRLEFGPSHRAHLRVQCYFPPGNGPFPVLLTNENPKYAWLAPAVRRGYIGCTYFAGDTNGPMTDDSDGFIEVYPDYDFSCLARRAWAAMRAADYLYSLPEVDKHRIALTGHSRNGKQALLAAAFDDRFAAVIPSSGNTGEGDPWRYTTDMFVNESIEQITGAFPFWFHPRLRFFAGREHKLPVDQNLLMALVAPRGLMLSTSYSESEGNPWGFEQAWRSVRKVYQFLGHEEKLALYLRNGEHPTVTEDIERFVDFCDSTFGRRSFPRPAPWLHGYSFERWEQISGEKIDPLRYPNRAVGDFFNMSDWGARKKSIREAIRWALGSEPPAISYPARTQLGQQTDLVDGWATLQPSRPLGAPHMRAAGLAFGDGLKGDLYYPSGPDGKPMGGRWPVVIWLHPYSYGTGYSRITAVSFASLTKRGFAVLAFDQIGFGARFEEAHNFYDRYPNWSLLGKMVSDTRAAIDALSALDTIDSSRISIVGYALGAKVGLFAAALDERVKAVASVCGFTDLRLDTADRGTEGLRHYSHLHGLVPRFGFFIGQEGRLPIDYDEVLAAMAPRRAYIVAPTLDRYATATDVASAVEAARKVYRLLGHEDSLELEMPVDFNRFTTPTQERVFDWLARAQ